MIWSVDRAAGIAALLLASGSIVAGLLQGRGGRRLPAADRFPIHEALGIGVVVAIALHGAAFAFDGFFGAGPVGALVPFASPYRPPAVALGQIGGYGLIALSLTFYLRRRWGTRRWRAAHRFIPVFWALALVHGLAAGTDATAPWFLISALAPAAAGMLMLASRYDARATAADRGPSDPPSARSGRAREPAVPTRTGSAASLSGR